MTGSRRLYRGIQRWS